jgi:hypothetical protein
MRQVKGKRPETGSRDGYLQRYSCKHTGSNTKLAVAYTQWSDCKVLDRVTSRNCISQTRLVSVVESFRLHAQEGRTTSGPASVGSCEPAHSD